MQRRTAFLWAGVITAVITSIVVIATGVLGVPPAEAQAPATATVGTGSDAVWQEAQARSKLEQAAAEMQAVYARLGLQQPQALANTTITGIAELDDQEYEQHEGLNDHDDRAGQDDHAGQDDRADQDNHD